MTSPAFYSGMSWRAIKPRGTSASTTEAIAASHLGDFVSGQDGSSGATMPNRHLFLFVQVRFDVNECYCYRSDDRFLLLLRCPYSVQPFVGICAVSFSLLLCCGDIESHYGLLIAEQLDQFTQILQLLNELNARSQRFETG